MRLGLSEFLPLNGSLHRIQGVVATTAHSFAAGLMS